MNRSFAGWLMMALLASTPGYAAENVYIVTGGRANAEIVIADNPPRLVSLAATELRDYVKKITGAELTITNMPATAVPVKIYVGKSAYTDKLGVTDEGLKYGAFRMKSGKDLSPGARISVKSAPSVVVPVRH